MYLIIGRKIYQISYMSVCSFEKNFAVSVTLQGKTLNCKVILL